MILVEELRKKERTWEHFLFWGGFKLDTQTDKGKRKSSRKLPNLQRSLKRRRSITLDLSEEPTSSSKVKKAKKKLVFKEAAEQASTQQTKQANVLNLPYSEFDSEPNKEEVPANQNI